MSRQKVRRRMETPDQIKDAERRMIKIQWLGLWETTLPYLVSFPDDNVAGHPAPVGGVSTQRVGERALRGWFKEVGLGDPDLMFSILADYGRIGLVLSREGETGGPWITLPEGMPD
jgi:hypothetical protein